MKLPDKEVVSKPPDTSSRPDTSGPGSQKTIDLNLGDSETPACYRQAGGSLDWPKCGFRNSLMDQNRKPIVEIILYRLNFRSAILL